MKMMPRDKALLAYGKARGILAGVRKEFVVSDVVFGISKQESITSFRKNHPLRHRLVKDAWQKRAAFKAWVPMEDRYCNNCLHFKSSESNPICAECSKWADPVNWEPRKEDE